jgi:2-polyprenyl-3-methyl-5-hydroxy-6-metoxy-1,4-benzoquinol methylase
MQVGSSLRKLLLVILPLAGIISTWSVSAQSQAAPKPPDAPETAVQMDEQKKRNLEIQKLEVEIQKLESDRATVWIGPAISALSVLIVVVTVLVQRQTSTALQKRQGELDLELKVAEFIMSSRSPNMARQRADLLGALYQRGITSKFLESVQSVGRNFPGDLGIEMRTEFFTQVAAKYDAPDDVANLFRQIFPKEEWLDKVQIPPWLNPNKALWEKGDFTRIAQSMRESGETLVKGLGITKGLKVLDLGCGDGTTALPEARLGADVLGVDIATNLVEAGNKRAKEEGLTNCKFQEGDASNLHELKDRSFDLVVSIFGAMFAPKPFDVAKEMVRVTRPGGRIVMENWIPNDPTLVAQILKISSAYSPPPPEGFVSPMTWGIEKDVIERFAGAGIPKEKISFVRDTYTFNYPGPPSELVDAFRKYYGPTMNAFEAAEKNGRAGDLQKELDVLFNSQNKSPSKDAPSIPATFLRVTVALN